MFLFIYLNKKIKSKFYILFYINRYIKNINNSNKLIIYKIYKNQNRDTKRPKIVK